MSEASLLKTETELIERILDGEWRHYAILVDKYERKVFNYANYLMGNREDAEEVTQDTFVKAYRSLNQFRGDAAFSTWVMRIAHYGCLTRFRKKKLTQVDIEHVASQPTDFSDDPSKNMQVDDKARILQVALGKLKEDERSVITLFYYQDMAIKEIVKVTTMTESNVKILLHRGRKKLLSILTQMGIKASTL